MRTATPFDDANTADPWIVLKHAMYAATIARVAPEPESAASRRATPMSTGSCREVDIPNFAGGGVPTQPPTALNTKSAERQSTVFHAEARRAAEPQPPGRKPGSSDRMNRINQDGNSP